MNTLQIESNCLILDSEHLNSIGASIEVEMTGLLVIGGTFGVNMLNHAIYLKFLCSLFTQSQRFAIYSGTLNRVLSPLEHIAGRSDLIFRFTSRCIQLPFSRKV